MDVVQGLLKVLDVANPLAGAAAEFLASKLGLGTATVDAVQQTISGMSGADQVKLKQIAADLQDHLAQYNVQLQVAGAQAEAAQVAAVNTTLQTDARGDSWWQKNHHAFESSFALLMVAGIYIILPVLKVPVPSIDPTVWLMIGGILGVTAWQHGQVNQALVSKTNS
jgi:hypothetical protein